MTPLAIIELGKEALRLVNNLIEDQPAAQRRASAMLAWNAFKVVIWPFLTEAQRKEIEEIERQAKA